MFWARDEFKRERASVETRIPRGSALGSESVDLEGHVRDGGCEWWRTSRQSETVQNCFGRIRWMDGRVAFGRAKSPHSTKIGHIVVRMGDKNVRTCNRLGGMPAESSIR